MKYLTLLVLFVCTACANDTATPSNDPRDKLGPQYADEQSSKDKELHMITVKGKVVFKTIEGGFWGFDAEDGKSYTPHGLKKEHRRDGVILEVTGYIDDQMVTFTQYGPILKIQSSTLIDDSQAKEQYY